MSRAKSMTLVCLSLLTVPVSLAVTATPASAYNYCQPGYVYQVTSHNYSFMASSNYGTAGVYNDTGQWNTESYTFTSNTNWTTSLQVNASISVSASIYIVGIQASTGVSVSTSVSKGTGWSLTASVSTPPYRWAFFQPGNWGELTTGAIYYVYSNCTETFHGNVYYANAPHPGAAAIHAYHS